MNPDIRKIVCHFLDTSQKTPGYTDWVELVAEYSYFILNRSYPNEEEFAYLFKEKRKIFEKYGSGFLPHLARMSLEEVMDSEIIKIS